VTLLLAMIASLTMRTIRFPRLRRDGINSCLSQPAYYHIAPLGGRDSLGASI
jgi:hypothetical protein